MRVEPGHGGHGRFLHFEFIDVLAAVAAIGVGTTGDVHRHLEPTLPTDNLNNSQQKRRKWVASVLMHDARKGWVEYVIERNRYYWTITDKGRRRLAREKGPE